MRLSKATGYALYALAHLAGESGDGLLTAARMAAALNTHVRNLHKVLRALVTAGLVRSLWGYQGGYRLTRPLSRITLLEVVEAADDVFRRHPPLGLEAVEVREDLDAQLEAVCDRAADLVRRRLRAVRVSDLFSRG